MYTFSWHKQVVTILQYPLNLGLSIGVAIHIVIPTIYVALHNKTAQNRSQSSYMYYRRGLTQQVCRKKKNILPGQQEKRKRESIPSAETVTEKARRCLGQELAER